MGTSKNLVGKKFGRLLVLDKTGKRYYGRVIWLCKCDCGSMLEVDTGRLNSGNTKSCGCTRTEKLVERNTTHSKTYTKAYNSWRGMVQRCNNPNHKSYEYYGKRGIKVCKRWSSFENFYEDMGDTKPGLSLDRIDNNKNYSPDNCRWVTYKKQANNRNPKSRGPQRQFWFRAWHKDSMSQYMSNSQRAFSKKWGIGKTYISACLSKRRKQAKGWTFERI